MKSAATVIVALFLIVDSIDAQLFQDIFRNIIRSGNLQNCDISRARSTSFKGQQYVMTFGVPGCEKFTHDEANRFCQRSGMRMISLDTPEKATFFNGQLGRSGSDYYWTGGRLSGSRRNAQITWPNGQSTSVNDWPKSERFFSHTGGANRPQPDNREGNEHCLAVLNNFYRDGVRFHDVACHHRKPTICEN